MFTKGRRYLIVPAVVVIVGIVVCLDQSTKKDDVPGSASAFAERLHDRFPEARIVSLNTRTLGSGFYLVNSSLPTAEAWKLNLNQYDRRWSRVVLIKPNFPGTVARPTEVPGPWLLGSYEVYGDPELIAKLKEACL